MKSAFECFQHAAKCEQLAKDARAEADRALLLATAEHWKMLGNEAKPAESVQLMPDHHRKLPP